MHTQPLDYPDEVESFGRYSWPGLDGDPDSGVPFLRPYTYNKKHALSHLEGPYWGFMGPLFVYLRHR